MFTNNMFKLIESLDKVKRFLWVLEKLELITERQSQVLYHHSHSLILEEARRLR